MKYSLVFATNNNHKLEEARQILGESIHVLSLSEVGINEEIPEDYDTLEENALQKANYVFAKTNLPTFADDTGLEVDALNGEPGVFSARYAGPQKNSSDNIKKLLFELKDKLNKNAQFRCVFAYVTQNEKQVFEGIVRGKITETLHGFSGFGYDPIFIPEGNEKTFAELSADEKNAMSHRGRASQKLKNYLTEKNIIHEI